MWCEGVVLDLSGPDHRTRTVGARKIGEFVEHLSDCTVTKNSDVQKSRNFGFCIPCVQFIQKTACKNTTAITELSWIYQTTNLPMFMENFLRCSCDPIHSCEREGLS
jgi:hypothetical protein